MLNASMQKSIYSADYEAFLALLLRMREEAGLTQEALAYRLEKTQSFISKCERGERRVDVVELCHFCDAIGVPFPRFAAHMQEMLDRLD